MGNLAYRSSKLCYNSSKLAFNNPWVKMTKSMAQNKTGQYDTFGPYYELDQYFPYMTTYNGSVNVIDQALANYQSASWVAGDAVARIQAAHSHGIAFVGYSMRPENFFLYQEGMTIFSRPAGLSTVTSARLWISNVGELFHTIHDEGRYLWINMYDGLFSDCSYSQSLLPYLNNTWLEIVISVSSSIFYTIKLNRSELATLNAQAGNGKVAAGLGSYSYMYAGSICLTLPSEVISMLNNYSGVAVDIFWNWEDAIVGPACETCLHLDNCSPDRGQSNRYTMAASPWATRTALARLGDLEAR